MGLVLALLGSLLVGTRASEAQTAGNVTIFDDAFVSGFSYNQWNSTNNVANTSPVKVGAVSNSTKPDAWD